MFACVCMAVTVLYVRIIEREAYTHTHTHKLTLAHKHTWAVVYTLSIENDRVAAITMPRYIFHEPASRSLARLPSRLLARSLAVR